MASVWKRASIDSGTHVKKAHVRVEAGVEEERRGRAEGPREVGFEHCVGVAVIKEGGAA
jgi:hypothetical protein